MHAIFLSYFYTLLQIVAVLRHFLMLLTVTSIFNKGTASSVLVAQWDGTGF